MRKPNLTLLGTVIVGFGVYLYASTRASAEPVTTSHPSEVWASASDPARGLEVLAAAADVKRKAVLIDLLADRERQPSAPSTREENINSSVREVEALYMEMSAARGLYNVDHVRERLYKKIVASEPMLAISIRAIADPSFAREAFGERQAEARFLSSQVLQYAAKSGDDAPLLGAVNGIAARIHARPSPGVLQDLEELMLGWARLQQPSVFEAGPSVGEKIGYRPDLPDDVRTLYKDTIYLALYPRIGMERAQAYVDATFPE